MSRAKSADADGCRAGQGKRSFIPRVTLGRRYSRRWDRPNQGGVLGIKGLKIVAAAGLTLHIDGCGPSAACAAPRDWIEQHLLSAFRKPSAGCAPRKCQQQIGTPPPESTTRVLLLDWSSRRVGHQGGQSAKKKAQCGPACRRTSPTVPPAAVPTQAPALEAPPAIRG